MTNCTRSVNYADRFSWMAIIASLVLPAICLDYIWATGQITVPYGQYIFFGTTLLSACILFFKSAHFGLRRIFLDKKLWFFLALFLAGVAISSPSFWGVRLLSIIALASLSIVIVGCFVHEDGEKWTPFVIVFLLAPFAIPVYSSFLLEFFGPFEFGVLIQNIKHMEYSPPRWHFLYSSANGFGFSAAFVTVSLYVAFFKSSKASLKIVCCLAGLVACYVLILSGTRAAYIFALASVFAFHLFHFGWRPFLWLLGALLFSFLIFAFTVGIDNVTSFLRLDGSNLSNISSGRWQGITGMWEIFASSPISGMGFGAADNNFPVYPSNIFYVALPVEVGAIGFIGAIGIIGLPAFYIIKQMMMQRRIAVLKAKSYLCVLSVCVLAGFMPYLMFEFNILRVSGVNQLFFFCWGMAMLEFSQQNKSQRAQL